MSDIVTSINNFGQQLVDTIGGIVNFIVELITFTGFFVKSLFSLISNFFVNFWSLGFSDFFITPFGDLGQYLGLYTLYVIYGLFIIMLVIFYKFIMRRLRGH